MRAIPTPNVIYPAQSIITIISRAWNLFRTHFKNSILCMLPPVLMMILMGLLSSAFSSGTFLTPNSGADIGYRLILVLLCILLFIPSCFAWVFSVCALSRYFFSAIVGEQALSVKQCWLYVAKNWSTISLLTVILYATSVVLIVIDLIILFLGFSLAAVLMGSAIPALGLSGGHFAGKMGPVVVLGFLLVLGFAVLATVGTMITMQGFIFTFPLLSISTAPQPKITGWWTLMKKAYKLLFNNLPRLVLFTLALFILSLTMTSVLMTPAWIWMFMEMTRLGVSQQHHIPMHVQMIVNIWSGLSNLILLPFYISAMTLLWYDCQVRQEGLDLRLWFNQLIRRQGQQPDVFDTVIEPQPG